jgi:hypothetical protein
MANKLFAWLTCNDWTADCLSTRLLFKEGPILVAAWLIVWLLLIAVLPSADSMPVKSRPRGRRKSDETFFVWRTPSREEGLRWGMAFTVVLITAIVVGAQLAERLAHTY